MDQKSDCKCVKPGRWGAEHFEACLIDYTPDANYGNWAYRILPRPCLASSRQQWLQKSIAHSHDGSVSDRTTLPHLSTLECVAWPVVHDCKFEHTLFWCPELKKLTSYDLMREPWRLLSRDIGNRISVKPYKDSPLWFCAANRNNWDYEYFWLPGSAYVATHWLSPNSDPSDTSNESEVHTDFELGKDYPFPMVRPINLHVALDQLPMRDFRWGDSCRDSRPHVV